MAEVRNRIALKVGEQSKTQAEIVSFNNLTSDKEHIAVIFKQADILQETPLVRVHSECLTGDVFHSSRCDCGEQLDESMQRMEKEGGVILYLRQEGRGIGLYNKIDAYKLQDAGMNTYEANNHLGFKDDLRDFNEAGQIIEALALKEIRLITNNPLKVKALQNYGIDIKQVINTSTHLKDDNESYLKAKAANAGHNLKFAP